MSIKDLTELLEVLRGVPQTVERQRLIDLVLKRLKKLV